MNLLIRLFASCELFIPNCGFLAKAVTSINTLPMPPRKCTIALHKWEMRMSGLLRCKRSLPRAWYVSLGAEMLFAGECSILGQNAVDIKPAPQQSAVPATGQCMLISAAFTWSMTFP
jgi:hypothetical protein